MNEKKNTKFIGDVGEELVSRFLVKRGFSIVERNYRKKWGEIDIIAKKGNALHFVEVKTQKYVYTEPGRGVIHETVSRESSGRVTREPRYRPEEKVHPEKLKRMKRAIETYLAEVGVPRETELNDRTKPDLYVDVVTVLLDTEGKKAKIDLIENVIA